MADDWKQRAIAGSTVIPDWKRKALEGSVLATNIFDDKGPDPNNIDESEDAPISVRTAVGALDKKEDRLAAIRKTYPDAQPYGDGNFIYTDPKTGKTHKYNNESWIPSKGDFASIAPEIGETGGSILGGALGALLGTGAAPVAGTAAGGILGAGLGGTAGREATQRGINYIFGNDDTRTTGQQIGDAATTFGLNAAGDGIGRALGAGVKAAKNGWVNYATGGVADDPAKVMQRADDWKSIGVTPTTGMTNGNIQTSRLEHALVPMRAGKQIQQRIDDAFNAQNDEFGRIIGGISDQPLSVGAAGEALQKQAQLAKEKELAKADDLYTKAGQKITSPARVDATSNFLAGLQSDRAGMGEFQKLTQGSQTDSVIKTAKAIVDDAQKGMSFDNLKAARTHIGQLAADTEDKVLKGHLNGLYKSLSDDMENTAKASGDDALSAFKTANDHFKQYIDPVTGFGKGSEADTVLKKNTDDILTWTLNNSKNGGNKIAAVRRTIQKADDGDATWNSVLAGVTDRLGRNSADDFDPGTFMRNWNAMSDEAKGALFDGTQNQQYKSDLDKLARIADTYTKYGKGANHSNTANHQAIRDSLNPLSRDNAITSFLGSAVTGIPMAGVAIGAAKGAGKYAVNAVSRSNRAKLLTSPDTVNWMANLPKAEMQKGGLKAHFGKLYQIGKSSTDNGLSAAIDEYLKANGYQNDESQ